MVLRTLPITIYTHTLMNSHAYTQETHRTRRTGSVHSLEVFSLFSSELNGSQSHPTNDSDLQSFSRQYERNMISTPEQSAA